MRKVVVFLMSILLILIYGCGSAASKEITEDDYLSMQPSTYHDDYLDTDLTVAGTIDFGKYAKAAGINEISIRNKDRGGLAHNTMTFQKECFRIIIMTMYTKDYVSSEIAFIADQHSQYLLEKHCVPMKEAIRITYDGIKTEVVEGDPNIAHGMFLATLDEFKCLDRVIDDLSLNTNKYCTNLETFNYDFPYSVDFDYDNNIEHSYRNGYFWWSTYADPETGEIALRNYN